MMMNESIHPSILSDTFLSSYSNDQRYLCEDVYGCVLVIIENIHK